MFGVPRVRPLRRSELAGLPPCPDCGFRADPDQVWARDAQQEWGMVGVEFGSPTGVPAYALVALPTSLPGDHPLFGQKQCPGTAILLAAHVEGDGGLRQRGLSRLVVTSLVGRLSGQVRAIEAAGARVHPTCQAPSSQWLADLGFRPAPGMEWLPAGARRMRLDLHTTVAWKVPWARALRRVGATSRLAGWRPVG
ncbi:hypothetical protein IPV09_11180 [Tessaracoccus sp. SD287]|uniref:hypothetical protein n=1 Tax=Tessaracoccus sp. SD287 TaxID=2782008 RepID=UPI001A95DD9F|nr:hypothetical protein [Tessaracoccus sp. SD287]MBO1031897.1 hypothetical protein [Tessaracoccus sp. SD287]